LDVCTAPFAEMMRSTASKACTSLSQIIFDDNSDGGRMSSAQFKLLCKVKLKYTEVHEDEFDAAFVKLDVNGAGYLTCDQFQEWWRLPDLRHDFLKFHSDDERTRLQTIRTSFFEGTGGNSMMTPEQFRLKCYISGYCLSDEELEEAFCELDKDRSGSVDFVEYLRWRVSADRFAHLQHDESDAVSSWVHEIGEYFRMFDTELSGYLDQDHFEPLYNHLYENGQVQEDVVDVMKKLDQDGDGRVSLNEFIRWYLQDTTAPNSENETEEL